MDEAEETLLFDLAERLILLKGREPGAFDLVSISHIAHAFTSLLDRPAPPAGVDPHRELPELLSDLDEGFGGRNSQSDWGSSGDGEFASRSADGDFWPFQDGVGIGSAREGLELLEVCCDSTDTVPAICLSYALVRLPLELH